MYFSCEDLVFFVFEIWVRKSGIVFEFKFFIYDFSVFMVDFLLLVFFLRFVSFWCNVGFKFLFIGNLFKFIIKEIRKIIFGNIKI